jgi:hypothetical protein
MPSINASQIVVAISPLSRRRATGVLVNFTIVGSWAQVELALVQLQSSIGSNSFVTTLKQLDPLTFQSVVVTSLALPPGISTLPPITVAGPSAPKDSLETAGEPYCLPR